MSSRQFQRSPIELALAALPTAAELAAAGLVALPNNPAIAHGYTWALKAFNPNTRQFSTVAFNSSLPIGTILYAVPQWDGPRPSVTKYTVTFNSEGGSSWPPITGDAGTSVMLNLLPVRAGYTFNGWFDAPTGGSLLTSPHVLSANITAYAQWTPSVTPPPVGPGIMVVMLENQQESNVVGSSSAPFLNSMKSSSNYFGDGHPSLTNYIALATGLSRSVSDDNPPSAHPELSGTANLFSQLDVAGIPWGAFFESLSGDPRTNEGAVDASGNALYEPHHNPIAYVGTSAQIAKCEAYSPASLSAFLNASAVNSFVLVVPNMDDNMHDPSGNPGNDAASVGAGDAWLKSFMTSVESTAWYKAGGTVLLVWDEAYDTSGNTVNTGFNGVNGGPVAFYIVSSARNPVESTSLTHVGLLQSIEKFYGLPILGGSGYGDISATLEGKTPPPPPSGIPAMPTSLAGWKITHSQSFAGLSALPSGFWAWSGAPGGEGNAWWDSAHIQFNPDFVSLITSGPEKLPNGNTGYTSAGIGSGFGQIGGRSDVCLRFPSNSAGMSFIALNWPDSGTWPVDGEDDFVETGGANTITGFNATSHYGAQDYNPQVHTPNFGPSFDWTAFHVWSIVSSPGLRIYLVDNVEWGRLTNAQFPNSEMFLDVQAEYLGSGSPVTPCPFDIAWEQIYVPA